MADSLPTATPPATSGGITQDQLNAAVLAAVKPLADSVKSLAENQKTFADTYAADTKAKTDAAASATAGDPPKALTADDVSKLLDDRDKARGQSAAVAAAKDKIVKAKLNGIGELAKLLPDTADEAQLTTAAEALAKTINLTAPRTDVGGAGVNGGTPANKQPVDLSKLTPYERLEIAVARQQPKAVVPGVAVGATATAATAN